MDDDKQRHKPKTRSVLVVILVIVFVTSLIYLAFHKQIRTAFDDISTTVENQSKPQFVFDSVKFADWATSGNFWPEDSESASIASIHVSQCTPGSHCQELVEKCKNDRQCASLERETSDGHCMVSLYLESGSIDPAQAINDEQQRNTVDFGLDKSEIDLETMMINTPEGGKEYQLHQYKIDRSSSNYKNGVAVGYVNLSDSYIKIQSVCDQSSQLDEALPVLEAVSLAE